MPCLLLNPTKSPTDIGDSVIPVTVSPLSLSKAERDISGLSIKLLDVQGAAPTALLRCRSGMAAALASYWLLAKPLLLPAAVGVCIRIQATERELQTIASSSGLTLALALAEYLLCRVSGRHADGFGLVSATGTIDRLGNVGPVEQIEAKLRGFCRYLVDQSTRLSSIARSICFYPSANQVQINTELEAQINRLGGRLVPVSTLQEALSVLGVSLTNAGHLELFGRALRPYERQDRCVFLGRQQAVDAIMRRLQILWQNNWQQGGGSLYPMQFWLEGLRGSGKSSLLLAGVLAMLERPHRFTAVGECRLPQDPFRPAHAQGNLIRALAAYLCQRCDLSTLSVSTLEQLLRDEPEEAYRTIQAALRYDVRHTEQTVLLLVIDQWEQLYQDHTISSAERHAFFVAIQSLTSSRSSCIWLLGAISLDYRPQLAEHPVFKRLINHEIHHYTLGNPSAGELDQIIRGHLACAGIQINAPSLIERIVRDVEHVPAPLGPLSLALTLLEQKARSTPTRTLTEADYFNLNGLSTLLQRYMADSFYRHLSYRKRLGVKRILQYLLEVETSEPGSWARTIPIQSLPQDPLTVELLQDMVATHLVVMEQSAGGDQVFVRVAHEDLFASWAVGTCGHDHHKPRLSWLRNFFRTGFK